MTAAGPPLLEWGVASRALPGESESGDRCLVKLFPDGALVAVVDGLGHGVDAATAARLAVATLDEVAALPLNQVVERCHEALRSTRGVVMSVASFHVAESAMTWLGVGDVEAALFRRDGGRKESLMLRGGVVGYQLPPLRPFRIPVSPGDVLVLATDGIRSAFADAVNLSDPPQRIADEILRRFASGTDDALALAARYVGAAP